MAKSRKTTPEEHAQRLKRERELRESLERRQAREEKHVAERATGFWRR